MELFRFVAIETPSAAAVDDVLQIDVEDVLKESTLADALRDPATRQGKLKDLETSGTDLSAEHLVPARQLDAFTAGTRRAPRPPTPAGAEALAEDVFGARSATVVRRAAYLSLRARVAELHLVDRLAPLLRPRAEQLVTVARLRCMGLLEILAEDDERAERALRIPSCIAIALDSARLRAPQQLSEGQHPPGWAALVADQRRSALVRQVEAQPAPRTAPTAQEVVRAQRELRRAIGAAISARLEQEVEDDDSDSTETTARSSAEQSAASLATIVVAMNADPAVFRSVQAEFSPATRRVLDALGLGADPTADAALEAITIAQRRSGPWADRRRMVALGSGGLLWTPRFPLSTGNGQSPPSDGAPDTVGSARVLGYGPLYLVDDEVIGYTTGQLSEVYNVPMGSTKERELRVVERTEETSGSLTAAETSTENETESEERFSLASEARRASAFDAEARAGGSFSASYGTVGVEGSADASTGFHAESSEGLATAYAKNVVSRAATKVTERVAELRQRTTFRERTAAEREAYSNASDAHITGIYEWVNEVHRGRLMQYGLRLHLEVVVPRPAATLLWAVTDLPPDPTGPPPPPPFDVLLDDPDTLTDPDQRARAIDRKSYLRLAALYGATSVPEPPKAEVVVTKGITVADTATKGTFSTVVKTDESLRVPDGYEATRGWMRLVASRATDSQAVWYRVVIGTSQYKFRGGNASKRTFNHEVITYGERGYLQGSVPVSIIGREDRAAVVHVMLTCTPMPETMEAWRAEVYGQLLLAHKRTLQEYQDAVGSAFAEPTGRNPEELRRIERDEIKRSSLTVMTGQHFERFNALPMEQAPGEPPSITLSELAQERNWIQFFETAIEWENVQFMLYPYFWADRRDWARALTLQHDDPLHAEFLRAGAARVLIPVRRGFESAVLHYLESPSGAPVLWDGVDPDLITLESPMFVAVWQEVKERQGQLDEQPSEINAWRFEVPTSHRILRNDGVLPAAPTS